MYISLNCFVELPKSKVLVTLGTKVTLDVITPVELVKNVIDDVVWVTVPNVVSPARWLNDPVIPNTVPLELMFPLAFT